MYFCKEHEILTSFVKRGRPYSEEKKAKDQIEVKGLGIVMVAGPFCCMSIWLNIFDFLVDHGHYLRKKQFEMLLKHIIVVMKATHSILCVTW